MASFDDVLDVIDRYLGDLGVLTLSAVSKGLNAYAVAHKPWQDVVLAPCYGGGAYVWAIDDDKKIFVPTLDSAWRAKYGAMIAWEEWEEYNAAEDLKWKADDEEDLRIQQIQDAWYAEQETEWYYDD